MPKQWSVVLTQKFEFVLPPDVVAWFDEGLRGQWDLDAESPEDIMATGPAHSIWAGQMLPDTLPIFGDGSGDYACLRFSEVGGVREVGWWSHEGGGWRPLGDTLAESLLYFAARQPPARTAEAGIAVRRDLCEAACREGRAPDWGEAARHAGAVAGLRTDLAWPLAVLGRAAEAKGDVLAAVGHYRDGLLPSKTTADFTDRWRAKGVWSHRSFAAERLESLGALGSLDATQGRYWQALRDYKAREFWMDEAARAEASGDHAHAYRSYWNAGWDDFSTNDAALLDHLARTAGAAGFVALSKIAAHHCQCRREE